MNVFRDWCQSTSVHGVVDLGRKEYGKWWNVLWMLVIGAAICLSIRGCVIMMTSYYRTPIAFEVGRRAADSLELPDVVLCTHQKLSKMRLTNMGASDQLANGLLVSFNEPALILNVGQIDRIDKSLMANLSIEYQRFKTDNGHKPWWTLVNEVGVRCEDLILRCYTYLKRDFDCCRHATPVSSRWYGRCLRITELGIQNWAGQWSGAVFLLNFDSTFFDPDFISNSVKGALVDFVDPRRKANFKMKQLPVNASVTIQIQRTENYRINVTRTNKMCKSYFSRLGSYDIQTCFDKQYSYIINNSCGCSPYDPEYIGITAPACEPFYLRLKCFSSLQNYTQIHERVLSSRNRCLEACESVEYQTTVSYSNFDVNAALRNTAMLNVHARSGSYTILDIHYSDMIVKVTTELEMFPFDTLLANLGGVISLWLGASVITLVQMCMYTIRMVALCAQSTLNKRRRAKRRIHRVMNAACFDGV